MIKEQLDTEEIVLIVRKLVEASTRDGYGGPFDGLVLVGGCALCMHEIRESSGDVDLYAPRRIAEQAPELAEELRAGYGSHFSIDVTTDNRLWGQVKVADIDKSPVARHFEVDGHKVELRSLTPETVFILKAEAGRDKDIDDLEVIARHTTPEAIVERWRQMIPHNDPGMVPGITSNLFGEICAQYLCEFDPAWLDGMQMRSREKDEILAGFGRTESRRASPARHAGAHP